MREREAVTIHGDPRLLRVLADNLLSNALRHSDGAPVEVALRATGAGARALVVRDFGPGVPAASRELVFERFHRGTSTGPGAAGAGLGLSIVAAIARVHGASARLEDAAPGASVTVEFPAADVAARG